MPTSSIRFVREWRGFTHPDGTIIYRMPIRKLMGRVSCVWQFGSVGAPLRMGLSETRKICHER
jgi:hypothetical protein